MGTEKSPPWNRALIRSIPTPPGDGGATDARTRNRSRGEPAAAASHRRRGMEPILCRRSLLDLRPRHGHTTARCRQTAAGLLKTSKSRLFIAGYTPQPQGRLRPLQPRAQPVTRLSP